MGGFLRFVAWFVLLVAGFVLVGLPLLVGPLLAGTVRDMGVRADTVNESSVIGLGVDLIETSRVRAALARWGERLVAKLMSPEEAARLPLESRARAGALARAIAAKEAASKALGMGIGEVSWQDFSVLNDARGAPLLRLSGRAEALLRARGGHQALLSLSDERQFALAFVVLTD